SPQPSVRRRPAQARLFLIAIGTPANGRSSPAPTASAAASARSASTSTKALRAGSTAAIRSSEAATSSRAETSPARTSGASSRAELWRGTDTPAGYRRDAAGFMAGCAQMSEVQSGLEGVVAFATTIAEPDRAGGALRYRGVDIEDLVGAVPFEQVWGL